MTDLREELEQGIATGGDRAARCPHIWSSNCWEAWQIGAAIARNVEPRLAGARFGRVAKGRGGRMNLIGQRNGRGFKAVMLIEYDGDFLHVSTLSIESEAERVELELRSKSPMRSSADQADAGHLPLFIAAAEPAFL